MCKYIYIYMYVQPQHITRNNINVYDKRFRFPTRPRWTNSLARKLSQAMQLLQMLRSGLQRGRALRLVVQQLQNGSTRPARMLFGCGMRMSANFAETQCGRHFLSSTSRFAQRDTMVPSRRHALSTGSMRRAAARRPWPSERYQKWSLHQSCGH